MNRTSLVSCLGMLLCVTFVIAEPITLEVVAGKHLRSDTPVSWELPESLRGAKSLRLLRVDGAAPVPVNVQKGPLDNQARWILDGTMAPGTTRRYQLIPGPVTNPGKTAGTFVECTNDGKSILFRAGGRRILGYNQAIVKPRGAPDPFYDRSGYIHPVWTPSGRTLTNDFPAKHKHHHGIWFPWTNTHFEGRKVDFWNSGLKLGRIENTGVSSFGAGRVHGWFRVRHRFIDLTAPGGEKTVLHETWDVRIYALDDHFLFDLESVQTCASESPLKLNQYRYGGLGFRGSGQWEGEHCYFLTSEGKTRKDGHTTTSRWCEVYGKIDGANAGVTVMCHPKNFRFPQNMRIHPGEPFFNYAPCQAGDFLIEPGKPYVSRYRFYVHDGDVDPKVSERLWRDYAEPPVVRKI